MKIILCLLFIFSFTLACADTLYLKNGRSIEGIIVREDDATIELEVGSGSVRFLKKEIERIAKDSTQDPSSMRRKWDEQKKKMQDRIVKQQLEDEAKPRSIDFSRDSQGIFLKVLLDGKVETRMLLDTGATTMLITMDVADKLRIRLNNFQPDMKVQVADGRVINAKRLIIDRVKVEGVEARNVEAAVLLDNTDDLGFGDGLLGMSFLKNYNFKIDQKEKKIILEKYR